MKPDKEKYYEKTTRDLIATINKLKLDKLSRVRAKNFALLFRDSFKLPEIKHQTFWDDIGEGMSKFTYDSDGFCRVSSINFALLMGGEPDWKLMYIDSSWLYGPHHFLVHEPSRMIVDLTYDQYTHAGMHIPYYLGKPVEIELEENEAPMRFANALNLTPFIKNNQKD